MLIEHAVFRQIKLGSREEARDGINRTALREIKLLQELHHKNIINLLDVFGYKSEVSLVFEFMETDLEIVIRDTSIAITPAHIKSYILMTLEGLEYLHLNWILHRASSNDFSNSNSPQSIQQSNQVLPPSLSLWPSQDLKPNNLLLDKNGVLKLADFGLAKQFGSPNRVYTNQVVTRWYRAPELLYGARRYGTGVDVWAVGCILAELLLRVPLLPGETDLDQLDKMTQAFGTPTEEIWPVSFGLISNELIEMRNLIIPTIIFSTIIISPTFLHHFSIQTSAQIRRE